MQFRRRKAMTVRFSTPGKNHVHETFDSAHYRRQAGLELDDAAAWQHFQTQRDGMGLDPSSYFSTAFYKAPYRNWMNRGAATAFEDFPFCMARGQDRRPHLLIDPEHYRTHHADLAGLSARAALHFMRHGDGEGRAPSG